MMTPRVNRRAWMWVAALMLPLLFVRALVPAGFMASAANGSVHYTFCGGTESTPSKHGAGADGQCAFAQSAGSAPLPVHVDARLPARESGVVAASYTPRTLALSGSLRTDRSRAPPVSLI